ncbi:hypothetical protein, partial [Herbaspirillum sp. NPDC087042]|uniref:hypothetical protein n=1 Tax=Herbaspirillum sp. NPDC087042 TaxID=3364004 RepID=UPI0037F1D935
RCDEQDCGLNMGQLWMQISWESGSVFNANQQPDDKYAYARHEDIAVNIDQSLDGLQRASDGLAQVVANALVAGRQ